MFELSTSPNLSISHVLPLLPSWAEQVRDKQCFAPLLPRPALSEVEGLGEGVGGLH
jgi:hypothetical protein